MDARYARAKELMLQFADFTDLQPVGISPKRYLWTDAFAVCNFIELHKQTGETSFRELALDLVDQVHSVLGRHREEDERSGWISGLKQEIGRKHPTMGGLRIGKKFPERQPAEPYNEQLEWDRDGQYYHYLTKWMHALCRVSQVTGDMRYTTWAIELAKGVHPRFIYTSPADGRKYMRWKMSIDLSRPLVPAMGQHDPLDGFITCYELRMNAPEELAASLKVEINDLASICREQNWTTDDPLGIGGLLADSYRLAQMIDRDCLDQSELFENLLISALTGLQSFARSDFMNQPAEYRLAFRELGLTIGLHGIERLRDLADESSNLAGVKDLPDHIDRLLSYLSLAGEIKQFWLEPGHQRAPSWTEHQEINMVMLATSLLPDGYLQI